MNRRGADAPRVVLSERTPTAPEPSMACGDPTRRIERVERALCAFGRTINSVYHQATTDQARKSNGARLQHFSSGPTERRGAASREFRGRRRRDLDSRMMRRRCRPRWRCWSAVGVAGQDAERLLLLPTIWRAASNCRSVSLVNHVSTPVQDRVDRGGWDSTAWCGRRGVARPSLSGQVAAALAHPRRASQCHLGDRSAPAHARCCDSGANQHRVPRGLQYWAPVLVRRVPSCGRSGARSLQQSRRL